MSDIALNSASSGEWETLPLDLYNELSSLLNKHCAEKGSNTPDYVLAHFLTQCLDAFDVATNRRSVHYSGALEKANGV